MPDARKRAEGRAMYSAVSTPSRTGPAIAKRYRNAVTFTLGAERRILPNTINPLTDYLVSKFL